MRGAVKIEPWMNTPELLCAFKSLFIGEKEYKVLSSGVHKSHVIATLDGVETVRDAASLRGKKVLFDKSDADLDDGEYLIADLIGMDAVDSDTGLRFGVISDFLPMPAHGVYVVTPDSAERGEMLIPAVAEFVKKIDMDNNCVRFHLMEGL